MPRPRHLGKEAEDNAAKYLLGLGYTIITRRFHSVHGEVDLIALDQETLVFVEVKYRASTASSPEDAVGWTKRNRFHQAVEDYYAKTGQPKFPARYDIIAIAGETLNHYQDAFRAEQKQNSIREE